MRGMPAQLGAAGPQRRPQGLVPSTVADVPLAGCDDFQRAVALFVELHRMGDRARFSQQRSAGPQERDGLLARAVGGTSGQRGIVCPARLRHDRLGWVGEQPAVPADHRSGGQLKLPPPGDVRQVAEGADHRDAGPLLGVGEPVREHRHLDIEQGSAHRRAEQRLVPLVVRMRDQGDTRGQQLRPGGFDEHCRAAGRGALATRAGEHERVVSAWAVTVLQLRLGDRCPEGHVPQRRRLREIGLAASEVAQEGPLGDGAGAGVDRRVGHRPVH